MRPVNILGIETRYGFRTVELYGGDLTQLGFPVDVLVLSAFAGSYEPTPGTLIRALHLAFALEVERYAEHPAIDLRPALGVWISARLPEGVPFRRLLGVEMLGTGWDVTEAVDNVFASLLILEAKGEPVPIVALPLLGAGSQGFPPDRVAAELLPRARAYLERSTTTDRLVFAEISSEKAALVAGAMDRLLGREKVILPQQQLTDALRQDISNRLHHNASLFAPDCEHLRHDWLRLLQDTEVRSVELGVHSRKLVELMVEKLGAAPGHLANRIRDLEATGAVAPWVCAYMHVLRQLGNEAAHENLHGTGRVPPVVAPPDLIAGMFCVQRLLDSWDSLRERAGVE